MAAAAIILAAGKGTRMKSRLPKVLHPLAGRPMVLHVLDAARRAKFARAVVVVGPGMEAVARAVAPAETAVQAEQLGTGHAVLQALDALKGFAGEVAVLFGDTPLLTAAAIKRTIAALRRGASVAVLGFEPKDPASYGRLVLAKDGALERIVEFKDASPAERAIRLCNSGVLAADARLLFDLLSKVKNDNATGEYYLTDVVGLARARGLRCAVARADEAELMGVNSRVELAQAEASIQARLRRAAMESGVSMADPASVHLSWDTRLGRDVRLGPHVVFGPGVRVADDVEIRAYCHLEGARVASGAVIGPFARLRPGAVVSKDAHVGNFVEMKQAILGPGAKANHLTYLGDASVGAGANVGAGTITCNYDGYLKSRTEIGAGAFIGSNTALVAPVKIGRGAT
ncbi:MAG: bifunctional UDP-N-acetylglucosamine diphosphorylase/glucosamine-1-phosphate N-acetyltransferase GlmU, partial [Alphaproteobacteria bacterium]|nr:bifunctional UDP-N-acetylglucosamine diphosphorylase/glucosamine-1-phosphate N-acetyltransferase GlmU [Alphaproteobacteria bacterium]